ncbi:MAG: long-chain fatty acid--CoA ligase [Proteobacteria bacterium]|nr:long-chain fatty acid--CoA ligase [Pseudomonadota bacterium]
MLPWLNEYKVFGIPKTFEPYPDSPVFELLERTAKKYSNMGLVQLGAEVKYPLVLEHVERLATAFHAMGIAKGDRIATLLPTSIQFVVMDFAISRCGAVQIPCSHLEPADTLEYKLEESEPVAIVCLDEYSDIGVSLKNKTNIKHLILTNIKDYSIDTPNSHKDVQGAVWLMDLINKYPPEPPAIEFDVENDLETLLFTGGTTGRAKGCMLTHRNIYANAVQNGYAMGAAQKLLEGAITALMGLPFFHSYGHSLMHSMTAMGFRQLLVPDPRDTGGMVEMIKEYRPAIQVGVPTQFMKLLDEELGGVGILAISGSAALPKETQDEFEKKSGGGIMEGYGLSEMSPVTHLNCSLLLRIMGGRTIAKILGMGLKIPGVLLVLNFFLRMVGSRAIGWVFQKALPKIMKFSGRKASSRGNEKRGTMGIPFPDTEIKLVDVDSGREISLAEAVNERKAGEMCLSGPQRMLGYWPEKGSGMDEEGYIHTGDVVRIDENGYFSVVDRTKDMIIVSGYKVYSREVDEILYKYPAVEMAATVGVPDPEKQGSERVAVMIQPKQGHLDKMKEEEIVTYLRKKVAKYAVPKYVRFVDEIPLTDVQKVDKKKIREILNTELGIN